MVEFQADARVGFGKCIHFSKERHGLDNYKSKESLSRVVVILLEDKHLERQRKRQVFQSQQNIKLTNLYLMELQKIELCMNLMYVERRNTL